MGKKVHGAKRKSSKAGALSKQFMLNSAKCIAEMIIDEKVKNDGRVPWGFAAKLLNEGRKTFPNLSRRTINNYVIKLQKERKIGRSVTVDSLSNDISSLTTPNGGAETSNHDNTEDSSHTDSTDSDDSDSYSNFSNDENVHQNIGGRPKGSTVASSLELKKRVDLAMEDAVNKLREAQAKSKNTNERMKKGALTEIISNTKAKYDLGDSITINPGSIRQRVKRNTVTSLLGTKSPMLEIEPYIVSVITQLANMRVPITTKQGLQLCNSIIKGTKFASKVTEFQSKNLRSVTKELGPGYWRGFLRRNKHLIAAKKAVKFDTKRAEWCTYSNLEEMYNEIYSHLVTSGLAVKHDEAVWRNAAGEVVLCEEDACGMKSCFELIHPEWLVFVDEVGSNTSQAKDGAVGGQTYLCTKDGRPQQRAATKDCHFTILGFTAASGDPIMCAIIFAAKTMKSEWVLGFDPFVEWIGEENNVEENMGEGKAMPGGPQVMFRGKNVPCFCCNSENGSITGDLLKEMLAAIDRLEVFDREEAGLNPFLLLDGHGSRFELDFLNYINEDETKWECCIGLPYGTSYWQVGDSSEQNGCFKMALTKAKQELVTKKNDAGLEFAINRTDIVGLVQQAWNASFARVKTNIKATASRGWGPKALSYNALLHPEIIATKYGTKQELTSDLKTNVAPVELNLNEGLAATLVDRIVEYKVREAGRNGENAEEQRRKRKATAEERLRSQDKRISSGLLVSAGHFHLGPEVRDHVQQRADAAKEKEYNASLKKKDEYDMIYAKVQEIKNLNVPYDKWSATQLKIMVKWYKRDGDDKLPSKKQDLLERYLATCHRGDLPAPSIPHGFQPPPQHNPHNEIPPASQDNDRQVGTNDELPPPMFQVTPPPLETDEQNVARILLEASSYRANNITTNVEAMGV